MTKAMDICYLLRFSLDDMARIWKRNLSNTLGLDTLVESHWRVNDRPRLGISYYKDLALPSAGPKLSAVSAWCSYLRATDTASSQEIAYRVNHARKVYENKFELLK